ncbi:uncharacterized protein Pyn_29604 [Prunus yedoensis var. nudiflora]|uniref:Uncharacterized protein n=1 Tax=Prunus yedoensis var. nudiflora TaxID=2094558 RepID=A0A314UAH7_PRUYE|nr:uncharacterized protein Pyn_29604 [Prunus yedoensis var. nudiflora]
MPLLLKSPDSRDFSLIVSSDLIPGLRDHIYSWGNSKSLKPAEDRVIEEENEEVSNVCLAVVPWVASKLPLASRDQAASQSEPMEAEEIEMMDTDDNGYNAGEAPGFGRMMERDRVGYNTGSNSSTIGWSQSSSKIIILMSPNN